MALTKLASRALSSDVATNATHTGDVTGATALIIAADAVDIPMLSATGSPSSTTFLRGDNAWAEVGGAYNTWLIKTGNYTASDGDQLVCVSSSVFTITLPSGTTAGRSITFNNSGTASVTIARNSQPIGGVNDNAVLQPNASSQLVYINPTIGWKEL